MKTSIRINKVLAELPELFTQGVELVEDEHDDLPAYDMLSLVNRLEKLGIFFQIGPHYCGDKGGFYGYSGSTLYITPKETEDTITNVDIHEIEDEFNIKKVIHLFSFTEMLESSLFLTLILIQRALEKNPNLVFEIDVNQHAGLNK